MNYSVANAWLALSRPSPNARLRLFCFPPAGLGASIFRSWVGGFGADVDVCPVQLPGRESRQLEPPFTRMTELANSAARAIRPVLDVPFAFFGHSMGALVAFEIARRLGAQAPAHLFVSGRRAPHLPERLAPLGHLDDAAFIAAIQRRYDGIPAAVLECDDLMALLLPRLRADVATLEGYEFQSTSPLDCPISVFGGDADATVDVAELEAWREHSRSDVSVRLLRGGHLFLQQQRDALVRFISTDLGIGFARSAAVGI